MSPNFVSIPDFQDFGDLQNLKTFRFLRIWKLSVFQDFGGLQNENLQFQNISKFKISILRFDKYGDLQIIKFWDTHIIWRFSNLFEARNFFGGSQLYRLLDFPYFRD